MRELIEETPSGFLIFFVIVFAIVLGGWATILFRSSRDAYRDIQTLRESQENPHVLSREFPTSSDPMTVTDASNKFGRLGEGMADASEGLELGHYGPEMMKKAGTLIVVAAFGGYQAFRWASGGNLLIAGVLILIMFTVLAAQVTRIVVHLKALQHRGS